MMTSFLARFFLGVVLRQMNKVIIRERSLNKFAILKCFVFELR